MPVTDPRIDAYIDKAAPFAQPILRHLRALVHATCPDVVETIKWGFPHFMHAGAILCSMAAFKQHVAFGFWKGALIEGVGGPGARDDAMGQFGRIASLDDLPAKRTLVSILRKAMALNEHGVTVPARERKAPRGEAEVPEALAAALKRNAKARKTFEAFAPSHRREYCEWIAEAKRDDTRERRVAQAIEWLAEGKQRNWKYA
ncbi:YdeI/OmpD-associated family protein [Dokdonella sp. MW10]|uniref:YdeI/OmpD-associated family protein n=1 Tax=Dokdonella sp. MW10 TaxID=2992926 RepID=UPI003F805F8A